MCKHKNISPFCAGNFCPDCGKEIKISWVLLRCSCCNSKRLARVIFNSLTPRNNYCIKCGASDYYVESKESIEYFEFDYAVISKKEVNNDTKVKEILQIWIEKEPSSADILNNFRLLPLLVK